MTLEYCHTCWQKKSPAPTARFGVKCENCDGWRENPREAGGKSLYRMTQDAIIPMREEYETALAGYYKSHHSGRREERGVVIYLAECVPTGLRYVGQSESLWGRIAAHFYDGIAGNSPAPFHLAIRAHGCENIRWGLLAVVEKNIADEIEDAAIVHFGTMKPDGYNQVRPKMPLNERFPAPLFDAPD